MKRIQSFEFEDLPWFPKALRDYGTDFLQFGANAFDVYKGIVPVIEKGLAESGGHTIIDLGSGGGGGWRKLAERLKKDIPDLKILLTDYYPNEDAFRQSAAALPGTFNYISEPVDAMHVPERLKGLRTQFLSFHHFPPEQARQILQNAVDQKAPIGIFEAQQRNVPSLIPMLLSPVNVLLTTPFIRPFKAGRLLFTYLLPIVPLFVLWDGVVSVLRTYTPRELKEMTESLHNGDSYEWEIGTRKSGPSNVLYLLGYPKA